MRSKKDLEKQIESKKYLKKHYQKLNDSQRKGLDFLKQALGDKSKLEQFLLFDESKIKYAIKHINDELSKLYR